MRHLRMNLDFAPILAQLKLLLRAEILIAEEHHAPFSDQQRELISLLVSEVFQLQADDLRSDVRGEVLDLFRGGEQGGFLWICPRAGIDVFSVFVSDGVDILEVQRAGWPVLRSSLEWKRRPALVWLRTG